MQGNLCAVFRDYLFGFHVEALSDFVGRCFAQFAFPGYVRRDFDWLSIRKGQQAGIEDGGTL